MPENMGFQRKGLMDLLPEEIVEADRTAIKRYMQNETMGLVDCVCADCGKKFVAHREHRYRYEEKGRVLMYCSHRCFRKQEQKKEEAYRRRMMGAWVERKPKSRVEIARTRVESCEKRLNEALAKRNGPAWANMNSKQRSSIKQRLVHWQAELVLASTELEEALANEG